MTDMAALERRIDRLEARAEIAELCSNYCLIVDARDMAGLAALLTDDVVFESSDGGMDSTGIPAVIDMFNRVLTVRGPGFHWTHDRFVSFDDSDPDTATGIVLAHAETSPNGIVSLAALRYDDVYKREGGIWKFAKRSLTFFYYVPTAEYVDRFKDEKRFNAPDGWREADFPERLESWQQWFRDNGQPG